MIMVVPRDLPAGTVTFLFTDIEGSTRLLDELGVRAYADVLADHHRLIRAAAARRGGFELGTQGDALFIVFARPSSALEAAKEAQAALEVPVRMGIHTGEAELTEEGYVGVEVHRAARICAAAHGGQVLLSDATARLVRDELRELGLHRLRDVGEIRLYQLGDGLFPSLRALNTTNLPRPATPLIGRTSELADAARLLRDGGRLATLTGPGGIGKTRFALELAGELLEDAPDGVWFADLAPLNESELVIPTLAGMLGARGDLAEYIGDKELLLVLDNFEQVTEAAREVARLLERCPSLRLIVTSRQPLQIGGEREYQLRPLAEAPAAELFRRRAEAIDPHFEASDAELAAICRRLDNLPLAIELAAARTRALNPERLLERLEQRLPLLTSQSRDLPERHRTLRATIEWSYDLLGEDEQRLFRRLAVFAGGSTVESAEAVAEATVDGLESLVAQSLLGGDGERFAMLETVREFAAERLSETTEGEQVRERHAAWFMDLAAEPAEAFETEYFSQELLHLSDARPEADNFRAALETYIVRGAVEESLQLVGSLVWFWERTDRQVEGRRGGERALALQGEADAATRARALLAVGRLCTFGNDVPRAAELLGDALGRFEELDDKLSLARVTDVLADLAVFTGEFDTARARYEESLELFTELGVKSGIASAKHGLGVVHADTGRPDLARPFLDAAAEGYRERGDFTPLAHVLHSLGDLELDERRLPEATERYRESLTLARDLDLEQRMVAYCLGGIAAVAAARGDRRSAGRFWEGFRRLVQETGATYAPSERDRYERHINEVAGPEFDAGVRAGRVVPLARAIEDALSLN
jgi:predicted ATPase/class 3 adenylate cyclase